MKKVEIKQQLNNYTDKYQKYKKWLTKETDHYIFHYLHNSQAERDIAIIAKKQENAFRKITRILNLETPKSKIEYYFYPNEEKKIELMGDDGNAQAIFHNFTIHAVYTKEITPLGEHEDTHLLVLQIGCPVGFLQEGLAEYMSGNRKWQGKTQNFWLKEGFKKSIIPSVESMMSQKAWMNSPDEYAPYYYIFAGFFVKFLIEKYGLDKFKKLYKQISRTNTKDENIKVFKDVYGFSFEVIESDYILGINNSSK